MPVYLCLAGDSAVKIGLTTLAAFHGRMVKLQVDNHEPVKLLRLLDGGLALERALHKQFRYLHRRGEWFSYHPDMMGDLGAAELGAADIPAPPPPPSKHVPWQQRDLWTPERRATQSAKLLALHADPVRSAERLAKYRATLAVKAARNALRTASAPAA
jgi:hypothetical protein